MRLSVFSILQQIKVSWRPLVQVHLIFTLLGLILLGPLFGLLLQGLLQLSGSPAVSDQDIALLFLSPAGAAAALLLAGIFLAINAMEIGALMVIALAANHKLKYTPLQATIYALRHGFDLLGLTLLLTIRVLVYLLPLLALVGGIAQLLLSDYDINFYLAERPPQFMLAVAAAALLIGLFLWFVGGKLLSWCLALPLVLFAKQPVRNVLAESERLSADHKPEIVRIYAASLITAAMIGVVSVALFDVAGSWLIGTQGDHLPLLVLMLGGLIITWLVLNFFIIAFTLASVCFTTAELYQRLGPPLSEHYLSTAVADGLPPSPMWTTGRLIIGIVAAAGIAGIAGGWLLNGIQTEDHVAIIAHRGAAGAAPENTLASVRQAIVDGTDWVEIDVQETRDGQIVVVHDSDFMKLAGSPLKVWDGDLAQIQALDVGSWFDPRFKTERVPTLEQVLAETRGRVGLVIELKYYGHDQQLEQRVVNIVEGADMAQEISIMSLKLAGIQKLQQLRPEWTTGLLAATALGDLSKTDVDFLAVSQRIVNTSFIKRSHAAGKQVMVWTVNDPLSMSRWISMGVDGLITDEPALAREVLAERAQMSSPERLLLRAALLLGKQTAQNSYRDNSP